MFYGHFYGYCRDHGEEERAFDCTALPPSERASRWEKCANVQPEIELDPESMWNKNILTLPPNLDQILQQRVLYGILKSDIS